MRGLLAELQRRKVYRAAAAYAVVAWLLIQIATQVFPFFDVPNWAVRLIVLLVVLGFPVAVAMAWAFDLDADGVLRADARDSSRSRSKAVLIWAVLTLIVLAAYLAATRTWQSAPAAAKAPGAVGPTPANETSPRTPADSRSIAILPFVDLSQTRDQEYFGDGMSEELLGMLSRVDGLRVAARTSSFSFKDKAIDVHQVGQVLGVGSVLEGSVRRDGQRVRVTAELIDVASGFDLWSETFERQVDDLFAVQDQIARAIVEALQVKLANVIPARKATDSEAYDLYLQGVFFSNKSTEEGLRKSLDLFERSLAKDPQNAKAWSGIAKDWLWLADVYEKPLDAYPKMKDAAQKALLLDDGDAEAHVYLAEARRVLDYDPAASEVELRQALKLDPNSSAAHMFLGLLRITRGYRTEGLAEFKEALARDPLSPIISNFAAMGYILAGRYDDAVAEARRLQQLDPSFIYLSSFLADAYREQARYDDAVAIYQKVQQSTGEQQPGLAITYARMGRTEDARKLLADLQLAASRKYVTADQIAAIYAALGENDEAFSWLQRAYDEHAAPIYGVGVAPEFRALHSDPRFTSLLTKLGLDAQRVLSASSSSPP